MRTKITLLTTLAALGSLLPGAAWAQDLGASPTEPPGTADQPPPAPAGAAAMTPPPTDAPGDAPDGASDAAPAPPAPEAGPKPIPGWVRIDSDGGGLQLWGGGTFAFNDSVGLAFDMYVLQTATQSLGEFDIGPAITAGPFIITPMLGLQVDWTARRAQALVPQLYVVGGPSPLYVELWAQYYMNTVFNEDVPAVDPLLPGLTIANQLYLRAIVDFKLTDYVAIGPELDVIHDSEADVVGLAIGPNVLLSNVGAASAFMGYLAYETKDTFADNHLTGRLTFIHNF